MDTTSLNPTPRPGPSVRSKIALIRLSIGLIQGLLLYFLFLSVKVWSERNPYIFIPLSLICVIVPILLISSLGRLHRRPMAIWMLTAVIVLALLCIYDVWRRDIYDAWRGASEGFFILPVPISSPSLYLCLFPGFFIAHSLVLAGASDRKWIARYTTYCEVSLRLRIQVGRSFAFVCALLLVLLLGSALFSLINLNFLGNLLGKKWFCIPVTCIVFSCAMHMTDVFPATVRPSLFYPRLGIFLILPLIAVVFLLSLPLWATARAAVVLLSSSIILIVLINVAAQDATSARRIPRWIHLYIVYVVALTLLPLTAIAIYAMQLRVSSYGWTSNRIFMAASIFVVACFAIGYALAVCRRDRPAWITQVNVVMSFIIVGVLLASASPILDPARLSVNNQMARLADGRTTADNFDFDYLKFEGKRFGLAALNELKTRSQGADAAAIREKAEITLNKKSRWEH